MDEPLPGGVLESADSSSPWWEELPATLLPVLDLSFAGFGLVGGLERLREPPREISELAFELAEPVRAISAKPPPLVRGSGSTASSELGAVGLGGMAFEDRSADSALPPWLGGVVAPPSSSPDLRVMVILSGPLDSEPPRMNIFWWGGVATSGEVGAIISGEVGVTGWGV